MLGSVEEVRRIRRGTILSQLCQSGAHGHQLAAVVSSGHHQRSARRLAERTQPCVEFVCDVSRQSGQVGHRSAIRALVVGQTLGQRHR